LSLIDIPVSVEYVGRSAFDNTAWYNNRDDGVLYLGSVCYGYIGVAPRNTEIVLSDGTAIIAAAAFENKYNLISLNPHCRGSQCN